jgi:hypothetical protein
MLVGTYTTAGQFNRQETSEFAARAFEQAPDASAMRRTAIGIRSKIIVGE